MTSRTHDALPRPAWTPPSGKPPLSARMMRATWRNLPAKRHEAGWEPGLVVPAADGSPLRTDHYFPRAAGDFPTLVVRSPYGRGVPWSPMYGMLFAEQGFHVVLQSCRGTGGSGGRFDLWRNEADDGQATVTWLRKQSWFNGRLGTVGPSYLGYVQWALALDPPPELKAMVVQVGLHDPYALFHTDGALRLENALAVGVGMTYQHRGIGPLVRATLRLQRRLRAITTAQPLRGAYVSALGGEVPWLDDVMTHPDANDPYWLGASPGEAAKRLSVPTGLITGWHDALADQTFEQYGRLRRAGCETALLVGPWTHTSALQQGWPEVFAESLAWLRAHLCADPSGLRPTGVRVHVGGAGEWRDLDDWPLTPAATSWFPAPDGYLTQQAPTDNTPLTSIRYDPADPTPSIGGPLLSRTAGPRDNSILEAREDVLTFTGPPLAEPVDVLGPVFARLSISTDTGYADVFTRLCDVDAQGRSINVCDGLAQLRTVEEAPSTVTVPMSSTAHRFAAGHRVRWQISGGAHPRYARNPGTGESSVDATDFTPVRITLHADSELMLPGGTQAAQPLEGEQPDA
ncbi:CocE/NonD family hydrolase [Streptomyces sp. NBC_00841]|uniref:CocE/NonD family hydrolase n=1 Tax=unclassified Streptomyces TaxID=2593676 RepID=UPI0022570ED8|nr:MULTISPECIES: CocE/NonD family hydrolase [unclassified Streptomyces]MCX4530499.1 CocE/NonD family hydrolase [Streptomyces sp. NBC_01669]WSA03741.1 CocE/NonD family hydrolase [Streptomyces sp. NBC_00841]